MNASDVRKVRRTAKEMFTPDLIERVRRSCEEQGVPLDLRDQRAIAKIGRSLFKRQTYGGVADR